MNNLRNYIPDGMYDYLYDEANLKTAIEEKLQNTFKLNGFTKVETPLLEFYDVFDDQNKSIDVEKMYRLTDNNGRTLVLRPDMTTPIARVVSTKVKDLTHPIKLFYSEYVYRKNDNYKGKLSEVPQVGVEVIGNNSIQCDVEVISTAIEALLNVGVKGFKIELGQADYVHSLLNDLDLDDKSVLINFIENKNYSGAANFINNNQQLIKTESFEVLKELPKLFGGKEVLEKAKCLTKNIKALKALENLENIYNHLDNMGLSEYLMIDLSMVQTIHYYTGVIFKGYGPNLGDYILSGGRYDNLCNYFNKKLPATGFAINTYQLIQLLNYNNEEPKILIHSNRIINKSYELMNKLHSENKIAEISLYELLEDSKNYAKEKGYTLILEVTENGYNEIIVNT
jgi:ATP phosphoribosyltransferase regulatory subunit